MEPVTQTILGKSMSSAVSYGIQSLGRKIPSSLFGKDEIGKVIFQSSHFDSLIEGDIELINEEISKIHEEHINSEAIYNFFKYPGIECIIRQIYAANLPSNFTCQESIKDIEKEFMILSSQYFAVEKKKIFSLSSLLFSILIEGCQEALNNRISNSENEALAAISNYHSKIILDELAGIKENLKFLLKEEVIFEDIITFFNKYRRNLRNRHEMIPISNFEGSVRKPIEKMYVCPNFVKRIKKNEYSESIEFFNFLSKAHRIVLLGDPGSGKTTFTRKICYELSSRYSDRLFAGRELVPFVVVVRDYYAEKEKNNSSIIDFINSELRSSFQIETIPKGAFEYLLLNGYLLLIFDGLDELLDTRLREKMVDEIESFCNLYPSIPTIVTSRKIGYEEAALKEDMFEIFEITSFNNEQVKEFVEKWFNLDYDLTLNERTKKAKHFLEESEKVSELRSNSLMLSLMCNIYRQENYIPENRPKIYQKCSEMLFKRWDSYRGINSRIMINESKMESLISYLAYWIYTDEISKEGVSEEKLIQKATEYLYGSTFKDFNKAEFVAKEFINFSKGRAWILTAVGVSRNQELYKFTHWSFLEYFTARWFFLNHEETIELTKELIPKICKREWDLVAQLALQMKGENSINAPDKIATVLLKKAKESEELERKNLLSFAARSLEFLTPKPNIVEEITKDIFEFSLHLSKTVAEKIKQEEELKNWISEVGNPIEPILELNISSKENRHEVNETLKSLIFEYIKSDNECEAIIAAEIILELQSKGFYDTDVLKECYENNKTVFENNAHLCIQSFKILFGSKIETIFKLQGLEGILIDYINLTSPINSRSGVGHKLLIDMISYLVVHEAEPTETKRLMAFWDKNSEYFKKIGEYCLDYALPLKIEDNPLLVIRDFDDTNLYMTCMKFLYRNKIAASNVSMTQKSNAFFEKASSSAFFGVFCLLALFFEISRISKSNRHVDVVKMFDLGPLNNIFHSWLKGSACISSKNEFDQIGLTNRQKEFINNWMQGKVCFLNKDNIFAIRSSKGNFEFGSAQEISHYFKVV